MGREVVFEVTRAWNGVTTKRLAVSAEVSDCMFPFAIDRSYVVFAWKDAKGGPATQHLHANHGIEQSGGRCRAARPGDDSPVIR